MIALLKAVIPGALLSWIVATLVSSGGSRGGILYIERLTIAQHTLQWSWPLFIAATLLGWFILLMLD